VTERLTALARAHRAIEEMDGDPAQFEILAAITAAMNPPVYPEPTDNFTRVSVGVWPSDVYQLVNRCGGLQWTHVATDQVVEWWEICDKGEPSVLTSLPIVAMPS
jgi:hypothetical protein